MSTEIQTSGNQYLDLIRQVVTNPDVPVEKIKALMDMELLLEDRAAEKQFDAALIAAQEDVQTLRWDKVNTEKNSRNVSYPKIDKMLRPVRIKHHFTQSWDTEAGTTPDMAMLCCDLIHAGGHKRRYRTPMPIDGQGPKGGGVMTKPQAVNSGTSYGMRNLAKMIWNIPMLVDKEDIDGNEPTAAITREQVAALKKVISETKSDSKKFCAHFKIEKVEDLPAAKYEDALKAFEKKRARISETQAADLKAIAEEVNVDIPAFCAQFGVRALANLPANKYADALTALQSKRGA